MYHIEVMLKYYYKNRHIDRRHRALALSYAAQLRIRRLKDEQKEQY